MKVVLPDMFDPVSSSPVPSSVRVFAVQPSIKGCTTCTASRYLPSVNVGRQVFAARRRRMTEMAGTIADKVDVIVFAQGSMAYCEQYIADKFGKVVLSSPRFGAAELKKALEKKGTI
jgi:hypothetical protein